MMIESIIGIISGVVTIGLAVPTVYGYFRKQPLTELMNQLVDKRLTNEKHKKILRKMNRLLGGSKIKDDYIQNFVLNDRGKEAVFMDICEGNGIEPTEETCKKFLSADMKKFRASYFNKRNNTPSERNYTLSKRAPSLTVFADNGQTVYMSELLKERHPDSCYRLIKILEKHQVKYSFIKGTKDIWCRDYMPVQTKSGKLVQFKYDPSYLKGRKEWEITRSDVEEIRSKNDWLNRYKIEKSNINLDGGNVLICDGRAILSDRIFSENPDRNKESLKKELSELLECEDVIIIPALKSQNEDFTGHVDGMVRFVNRNTIVGNERRSNEYQYMKEGLQKALDSFGLKYIDIPFFEEKDPKHPDSAIGIYVNYLEVDNLIVMPIFNRQEDKQVFEIFNKIFPNKQIETINYDEIAMEGGLLNCTTWVVK